MKTGDLMLCTFEGDAADPAAWYPAEIADLDSVAQIASIRLLDSDLLLNVAFAPVSGAWVARDAEGNTYSLLIHDLYAIENASPAIGDVALLSLANGTRVMCRVDGISATYDLYLYHPPYPLVSISSDQVTSSETHMCPVGMQVSALQLCKLKSSLPIATNGDEKFLDIARASAIRNYPWLDRGRAPAGYIDGMALAFVHAFRLLQDSDALGLAITADVSNDEQSDALAWFSAELDGITIDRSTPSGRLIALFTILLGLGMRESSGKHCVGRDMSAENATAETAEAGLFQPSFNSTSANSLLIGLMNTFTGRTDLLDIFSAGVTCKAADWEDWGAGPGRDFQFLAKNCPLYAILHSALVLRSRRKHWGPVNRKTLEVRSDSATLFETLAASMNP